MKILVPLNSKDYIDKFLEAGAEEFYMGFDDDDWYSEFGSFSEINRMSGFKKRANVFSLDEAIEIADYLKRKNSDLFLTINSPRYDEAQLKWIEKYFQKITKSKIQGVIISCPELLPIANKYGIKTICSTMSAVYNRDILNYYKKLGANKIIFPRDITIDEIATMVKTDPELEYEVFLMRNGCVFSDSNCLCMHRDPYKSLCGMLSRSERKIVSNDTDFIRNQEYRVNSMLFNNYYRKLSCAICALYDFVHLGVNSGKIVGRADEQEFILSDVKLVKQNIEIAKNANSREDFLQKMIFPPYLEQSCNLGYSCYYPEIRFNK